MMGITSFFGLGIIDPEKVRENIRVSLKDAGAELIGQSAGKIVTNAVRERIDKWTALSGLKNI